MTEIDRYVGELTSRLNVGARDRARILAEVRDHLDDAIAHRVQCGDRREAAAIAALDAFGSPSLVASQFNAEAGARAMRRAPLVAFAAGLAVVTAFVVAAVTQPRSGSPVSATLLTQIAFFTAVLSFQIAVVAGICAASRALSLWRTAGVRGDDRALVVRCAIISTDALGVAAVGWATTMLFALNRLADPNRPTLVLGGMVMVCAAGVASATTHRLPVNASDHAADAGSSNEAASGNDDGNALLGLGERAIGVVRLHPVVSCATVAALSVWPAMSHAETTVPGALPWGLTQAATVVLGFIVLGPALGLRRSHPA